MTETWARLSPHRSKTIPILGILSVSGAGVVDGCTAEHPSQPVTVFVPTCLDPGPASSTVAEYFPTGDFPLFDGGASSPMNATGAALGLPAATRSVEVEVTLPSTVWTGVSLVPDGGQVSVLALPFPTAQACSFQGHVNTDQGESFGLVDSQHALVVGGLSTAVVDLGKGSVTPATPSLSLPRDFASITVFGTGALVAGGESPSDGGTNLPLGSAEVYQANPDGVGGGFTKSPLLLDTARAKHGAVMLSTGETLLVGGTADGQTPLRSLEFIAVGDPTSTPLRRTTLQEARIGPTVFRLPTGQIFVGGGIDGEGRGLSTGEWLRSDLDALESGTMSETSPTLCVPTDDGTPPPAWAFAPLEEGAVLAVSNAPPPAGCASNVFVLRPGVAESAPPLSAAATTTKSPMLLFAGAQSMPLMLQNSTQRWNPWNNAFDQSGAIQLPDILPTGTFLSADPGLALWVTQDNNVFAARFDTRNIYSTNSPATHLLESDTRETAPDRMFGSCSCACPSSDIAFNACLGGLTLQCGASVFLTDATFADFSITFSADTQLTLVLRDNDTGTELDVDLKACLGGFPPSQTLQVERVGAAVSAGPVNEEVDAGASTLTPCAAVTHLEPTERVAIGFRSPLSGPATTVGSVSVQRLGSPD